MPIQRSGITWVLCIIFVVGRPPSLGAFRHSMMRVSDRFFIISHPVAASLPQRGTFIHHARFSVALFGSYLREIGVLPARLKEVKEPILASFHHWMLNHRGVKESTLKIYDHVIPALLETVAGDAASIDARTLRSFFATHSKDLSQGSARNVANAVRMFTRYLIAEGISSPGLDSALPTAASWRGTSNHSKGRA